MGNLLLKFCSKIVALKRENRLPIDAALYTKNNSNKPTPTTTQKLARNRNIIWKW